MALGLLLLLAAHYWVDKAAGAAPATSITNALAHVENLTYSLRRAFAPKGVAELFSIFGLFWLPVLVALGRPDGRRALAPVLGQAEVGLLALVAVHALLSSDLARMGYLLTPAFTAALALSLGWVWARLAPAKTPPEH